MEHYHVANLNNEQLQRLKSLEEELNVVLIAYDDDEEEKPGGKHTIVTG
ncbi:MAG: hypothetical protein LPK26_03850 [Bacillaceae bacterium]|uniref:Uncharacterized protein n=1 Tax=Alkalihalobacterium chitinilyticum TaxID=2980103 RepID=A0ABT5VD56_9BACI|nr:hypothetical protein [Alkalihalobacterium chitinilyticum]MDE5412139.1 hypothetical protein [Alkalihalobacterium chitinilyticum]MEB1806432.1 hypothetical protein [Bacillaceae bacterium]